MFNWFRARCPVDPPAKAWVEQRLNWLADQFGYDTFARRAVVLPLEEFFPEPYDGSEQAVRVLLDQVCGYMDADPDRVELRFFSNQSRLHLVNDRGDYLPHEAGLYEHSDDDAPCIIHIETSELSQPELLVGTIAHELAHLRLMGEYRVDPEIFDNELLTDLTVVFHGLGIFLGNSPRVYRSQFSKWPGTNVTRPEYMSHPMFGYALAHAAWIRGERKPHWERHMRLDVKCAFQQGVRYLFETGDTTFGTQGQPS